MDQASPRSSTARHWWAKTVPVRRFFRRYVERLINQARQVSKLSLALALTVGFLMGGPLHYQATLTSVWIVSSLDDIITTLVVGMTFWLWRPATVRVAIRASAVSLGINAGGVYFRFWEAGSLAMRLSWYVMAALAMGLLGWLVWRACTKIGAPSPVVAALPPVPPAAGLLPGPD